MSIESAADQAARLMTKGTHPIDAAYIAAQQNGVDVSLVRRELAKRAGARRRSLRRLSRSHG
jgi:hypothetical protein